MDEWLRMADNGIVGLVMSNGKSVYAQQHSEAALSRTLLSLPPSTLRVTADVRALLETRPDLTTFAPPPPKPVVITTTSVEPMLVDNNDNNDNDNEEDNLPADTSKPLVLNSNIVVSTAANVDDKPPFVVSY